MAPMDVCTVLLGSAGFQGLEEMRLEDWHTAGGPCGLLWGRLGVCCEGRIKMWSGEVSREDS